MVTHVVDVGGYSHEIKVIQLSKTVWIATGSYKNEELMAKGRNEASAYKKWADLANYLKRSS